MAKSQKPGAGAPKTSPAPGGTPVLPEGALDAFVELTDQIENLRECQRAWCALGDLVTLWHRDTRESLNTVDRRGMGLLIGYLAQELDIALAVAESAIAAMWKLIPTDGQ